jgi:hypothetical protein
MICQDEEIGPDVGALDPRVMAATSAQGAGEAPGVDGERWWREHFGATKSVSWPIFMDYFQVSRLILAPMRGWTRL